MLVASGVISAVIWVASVGHWHLSWQLSSSQITEIERVTGKIESITTSGSDVSFIFALQSYQDNAGHSRKPSDVFSLVFGRPRLRLFWSEPSCSLKQGHQQTFNVRLKPVSSLQNLGGFSARKWAFSNQIVGRGTVTELHFEKCMLSEVSLRQRLIDKLLQRDLTNTPWLMALAFGERSMLSRSQWQLAQYHGISHLIAISGLHISVVMGATFWISGVLIRSFGKHVRLSQTMPLLCFQTSLTLLMGWFYAYLSGFGEPVTRAWLMVSLGSLMILFGRRQSMQKIMLYSCFVLLLLNPLALLMPGMWLSYTAIGCVCFSVWRFGLLKDTYLQKISLFLIIQVCLYWLMLPLNVFLFNGVSLSSIGVNLLAIPMVSMVLVPICLLAVVTSHLDGVSGALYQLADSILNLGLAALKALVPASQVFINVADISLASMAASACIAATVLMPGKLAVKLGLVGCLSVFSVNLISSQVSDNWKATALDVGNGLAVVISRHNRAIVIDTGAAFPGGYNMADAAIKPFLIATGIQHLDYVFISHFDIDHAGALDSLKRFHNSVSIPVISPRNSCVRGMNMRWQQLQLEVVWPLSRSESSQENHHSCTIRVSDGLHSVLLPGDIGKSTETYLSNTEGKKLKSTVLLAPHHGSNTSSGADFIKQVDPVWVVYSHGQRKGWNFPSQAVVNRYWEQNVRQFSTAQSGQVTFTFDQSGVQAVTVETFQNLQKKRWYLP